MLNLFGSWLIQNENSLKSIQEIYSKKFDGTIDYFKSAYKERASYIKNDGHSIVNIYGAMVNKTDALGEIFNITAYENVANDILTASNDSNDILILDIDSVGGMVSGISEVINAILIAKKNKKVYAYVSGVAFSAGYWLASQADEIIMQESSQVGSIGAMIQYYKYDLESAGIKEYRFVSDISPNKNPIEGTDEHNADMQAIVDKAGSIFVNSVAKARGITKDKVISDFGQGRVFFAEDAIKKGMADAIGSIQTIIERSIMTKKNEENAFESLDAKAIAREAIASERLRISAIQNHVNANSQDVLVKHFIETGLSKEEACAILDKVSIQSVAPSEERGESKLDTLMSIQENNPTVKKIDGNLNVPSTQKSTLMDRLKARGGL